MATRTFEVPNISCQHCVRRITRALSALPGVLSVQAEEETRRVVVEYEGAEALARVRATLEEIGYPPAHER